MATVQSFEESEVWQAARQLVKEIYAASKLNVPPHRHFHPLPRNVPDENPRAQTVKNLQPSTFNLQPNQ